MPMFMDVHDDLTLPDEVVRDIGRGAAAGATDAHGVRQVDLFYNSDGKVFCLLDAPDADAVRAHHADLDVPCGDVVQVQHLEAAPA